MREGDNSLYGSNTPFSDKQYSVTDTIDLQGKTWSLPQNSRLIIKGGLVKNGCLYGNNTTLIYNGVVFDDIRIEGQWIVPEIKSSMFTDYEKVNSIKNLFALSNPSVRNHILIDEGCYNVAAMTPSDQCIVVNGNTHVVINGDIALLPNDFSSYSIMCLKGDNITISGRGSIAGDKNNHLGNDGEWGMGIYVLGGHSIQIKNVCVKDCWGDCIYVTRDANNVLIKGCHIENGRRQGISIISADSVYIKNCHISKVGGTAPGYAIDVEPNKGDKVNYILIEKVKVLECDGGFMSYRFAENTSINHVEIKNCTLSNIRRTPLGFFKTCSVSVIGNKIDTYSSEKALVCDQVDYIKIKRNKVEGKRLRNNNRAKEIVSIERNILTNF